MIENALDCMHDILLERSEQHYRLSRAILQASYDVKERAAADRVEARLNEVQYWIDIILELDSGDEVAQAAVKALNSLREVSVNADGMSVN